MNNINFRRKLKHIYANAQKMKSEPLRKNIFVIIELDKLGYYGDIHTLGRVLHVHKKANSKVLARVGRAALKKNKRVSLERVAWTAAAKYDVREVVFND